MKKHIITILICAFAFIGIAHAQGTGQLPAGGVWGNPTASKAPASPATVLNVLQQTSGCSTVGNVVVRGASLWSCSTVPYAGITASDITSTAQFLAGTSSRLVQSGVIYTSEVTITYGSTTTVDFSTLINGVVTLTGNISTLTLSNVTAGKAGQIRFIQDGTGSRTWPAGGNTVLKYAAGALPALSTAANAVDVLTYSCSSATFCTAALLKDVRNP